MTVLVIGSSGQLAWSLAEIEHDDLRVVTLGRPEIDLTDAGSLEQAVQDHKPDFVVNAAAYTAVDKAEEDETQAFALNAEGPAQLARLCQARTIPLVHISTDYVFDGSGTRPYIESDPVAPLGVYGASKLEGERLVAHACPRHIILRTSWVYSPFGSNFVKTMLRLAGERDELGIVNDQVGNPTYAPHLAAAILDMLPTLRNEPQESSIWGVYHIAGSGETSWHGFAIEVFRQSQMWGGETAIVQSIMTKDFPTPAKRPANSRLDSAKLYEIFHIRLPDWRVGVADCVERLCDK